MVDASNALYRFFNKYRILAPEEIDELVNCFDYQKLDAEQYFLKKGQINRKVGFVLNGILRVFYISEKGEEQTRYFVVEDHFATDIDSFLRQTPANSFIQCISPVELMTVNYSTYMTLARNLKFNTFFNQLIAEGLLNKLDNRTSLVNEDAKTRYLNFYEGPQGDLSSHPFKLSGILSWYHASVS